MAAAGKRITGKADPAGQGDAKKPKTEPTDVGGPMDRVSVSKMLGTLKYKADPYKNKSQQSMAEAQDALAVFSLCIYKAVSLFRVLVFIRPYACPCEGGLLLCEGGLLYVKVYRGLSNDDKKSFLENFQTKSNKGKDFAWVSSFRQEASDYNRTETTTKRNWMNRTRLSNVYIRRLFCVSVLLKLFLFGDVCVYGGAHT